MLSTYQIATFVEAIDDHGYCIDEDRVTATHDEVSDFVEQWGRAHEVVDGLHIWYSIQAEKGERRRDLFLQDFGDVRPFAKI